MATACEARRGGGREVPRRAPRRRASARPCWAIALLLWSPAAVAGTVYGTLSDNRRPVSAKLWFTDQDGNRQRAVVDRRGHYEVILPPGEYAVTSDVGEVTPEMIVVFHAPQRENLVVRSAP